MAIVTTDATNIALAIQKQEGYGTPGAVTLNADNNPGGLISWPGYPTVNGFAQFPDYQTGFNAVAANVQSKIDAGMTLSQLTQAWAPSGASNDPSGINNPTAYANFISAQTGLPLNTPLNNLGTTSLSLASSVDSTDASSSSDPSSLDSQFSSLLGGISDFTGGIGTDSTTLIMISVFVGAFLLVDLWQRN